MSDTRPALDPAHAVPLPDPARRLLERHVPRSPSPEFNRGIAVGLEFALRMLREGRCTVEQAAEALEAAAAQLKAHLAPIDEQEMREALARYKQEFTAEMLAEYANYDDVELVSSEELSREVDDIMREEPSNGAQP
jgi:hypothetical protein